MGTFDFVVHLFAKPLGVIGIVLFLVGLAIMLIGNNWGLIFFFLGIFLAYISEKKITLT
jgi:hypothetical protein